MIGPHRKGYWRLFAILVACWIAYAAYDLRGDWRQMRGFQSQYERETILAENNVPVFSVSAAGHAEQMTYQSMRMWHPVNTIQQVADCFVARESPPPKALYERGFPGRILIMDEGLRGWVEQTGMLYAANNDDPQQDCAQRAYREFLGEMRDSQQRARRDLVEESVFRALGGIAAIAAALFAFSWIVTGFSSRQ